MGTRLPVEAENDKVLGGRLEAYGRGLAGGVPEGERGGLSDELRWFTLLYSLTGGDSNLEF